ncbi:MAG: cytochrome c [Gammaproteobacteria bacterium]|nr:cytochrome c [Gammaproteobacteria bacterium]MDD9816211.1 cytochrome c [Gammaproteobacteria bacterium]MDD9851411.1 cytochrome c [Gammaproteobacteria bacterium]MDD9870041.1 cytochrome c [Gammaproteobacteria bacterium]
MSWVIRTAAAFVLGIALLPAAAQTAGDAAVGRGKAFTCMGCHGAAGYRNAYPGYPVPKLGGQHADYIAAALRAYRSGERTHPTMRAHAEGLSDQDIADIADYFAGLRREESGQ